MSLSKFSLTLQKYISGKLDGPLRLDPSIASEINAWREAVRASDIKANDNLKSAANLLNTDQNAFRTAGMKKENTILVVTEDSLKVYFRFYNIEMPKSSLISEYIKFIEDKEGGMPTPFSILPGSINKEGVAAYQRYNDKSGNAIAVRVSNVGHFGSRDLVYEFLCYMSNEFRYDISKETFSEDFQVGHIESQSAGKLISARSNSKDPALAGGIIDKAISLHKLLDLASSNISDLTKYSELFADIEKDFTGSSLYMNVEMQIAGISAAGNELTNQGSGNLSKALDFTNTIRSLVVDTISEEIKDSKGRSKKDYRSGKAQYKEVSAVLNELGKTTEEYYTILSKMHKNLVDNKARILSAISALGKDASDMFYNLESSDSLKTYLTKKIVSPLTGEVVKDIKVSHKKVSVLKKSNNNDQLNNRLQTASKKIKTNLTKLKEVSKKDTADSRNTRFKRLTDRNTGEINLTALQNLINSQLQDVISANMGDGGRTDVLNYRTGRFASSAKVERLSQSREGMITAFYSYMKNPYATFSEGGRQSIPKSRDPKLLISKSIKEIAAEKVANRMRTVLV
jgi:hypothetical protein